MSGQRNIDSKREEFRKYLESSGVTDSLIRIMTSMYESDERPTDALQFMRDHFVQSASYIHELKATQQYLENARDRIHSLESENAKLKDELEKYKSKKYSQHSIENLEAKLNEERKAKENVNHNVRKLENKISELKAEIAHAKKQGPECGGKDSEGYKNSQEQIQVNAKLERNIALEKERLKILSERNTDVTEMDLDVLSQTELIRFVKQLERIRTDLQSNLREIEVNLDQQAQEYLRLNEMKNLYQAELDLRDRKRRQTTSNPSGTART